MRAARGKSGSNQIKLRSPRSLVRSASRSAPRSAWWGYVLADYWSRAVQNWQSEFLAVGSMALFSIYLRQRGSPESTPVGTPHDATGVEG
jgi:hypothetical protein